jgi:hypothetical protein
MFFRSRISLLLANILILLGCVQLFFGWRYANSARREVTTIGTILYVIGGRSTTYEYVFEIDGARIQDDSGTCHTALTPRGCKVGAPVLVYYDHDPALVTMLQDFGAASREKYFMGFWMACCGLLLIGLYFTLKRTKRDDEGSEEPDEG